MLLLPPLSVDTAAVYRRWDERGGRVGVESGDRATGNDLEAAAVDVAPSLMRWRDALAEATGVSPRLAGSGATWFVEGEPDGVAGLDALVVDGQEAPLVRARTVRGEGS